MERSVDQMNVGRSYPIWDSFLDEKLKKLQIRTDVKQEVLMLDDSFDREESAPLDCEFFCRTCSIALTSREEQVEHYKSEKHRKQLVNKLRTRLDSTSSNQSDTATDQSDSESDEEMSDSDWSDDEKTEQITSVNLDDSLDGGKGRARQEIQFYNKENDRISFFRAMVASRSEYLNDLEIHRRFMATRDCFLNKGDVSGDRYDAVLLLLLVHSLVQFLLMENLLFIKLSRNMLLEQNKEKLNRPMIKPNRPNQLVRKYGDIMRNNLWKRLPIR